MDINYFNSLTQISLNELILKYDENTSLIFLQSFSCTKNKDLEDFLTNPDKYL